MNHAVFDALDLTEEERDAIGSSNALRLPGLPSP